MTKYGAEVHLHIEKSSIFKDCMRVLISIQRQGGWKLENILSAFYINWSAI